jgi:hypothetical protein
MMLASMIEAVIQPRLGNGAGVSPRKIPALPCAAARAAQAAICSAVDASPATETGRIWRIETAMATGSSLRAALGKTIRARHLAVMFAQGGPAMPRGAEMR